MMHNSMHVKSNSLDSCTLHVCVITFEHQQDWPVQQLDVLEYTVKLYGRLAALTAAMTSSCLAYTSIW